MRNFYRYLQDRILIERQDRIAYLMAEQGVDPYWYIENYLDSQQLLLEGWLGGFFARLGNAWKGFWQNPNPEDTAVSRLEAAKKALGELLQMMQQNQDADHGAISVVMKGLEQSLTIVNQLEPQIQQLSGGIDTYSKTGVPHSDPKDGLPQELDAKWADIMHKRDALMKLPDTEEKAQKLVANDDELLAFRQHLEDTYRSINPHSGNSQQLEMKNRVEKWLQRIDNDTTFRQIENLLDYARKRAGSGLLVKRPEGIGEVLATWRRIAGATADPNQRKQQLLQWYAGLPKTHPIKVFIQQELQDNPTLGKDENELFMKYAYDWQTRFPHQMAR